MALETADQIDQLGEKKLPTMDDLMADFYVWLAPQEKVWEDDEDQLAELFTQFLRSPLRSVPEPTITNLQAEFYTWLQHHPSELQAFSNKLRRRREGQASIQEEIPPWQERWNSARMATYGQPQLKPERAKDKDSLQKTTAEKPLRD